METNKEKKSLKQGLHLYKFVAGESLDLKIHFPKYTMVKVEVFEYDINDNHELVACHG